MINTTIFFVRHGEVYNPKKIVYGRTDISLSEEGFQQVKNLAKKLKNLGFTPDVIYTSPLKRAVQSAQKIGDVYGDIKIIQSDDLQEVEAPELEGKPLEWVKSIGGDVYRSKETRSMDIEQPETQAKRILKALRKIRVEYKGQTVFVLSHGDPTAFAMWRLLHEGEFPTIPELLKENYIEKGGACKIVFDSEGKVLEYQLIPQNGSRFKKQIFYKH